MTNEIKRPVSNNPDERFKEVDFPFNEKNYPSKDEVIPKGELFTLTTSIQVRQSGDQGIVDLIRELKKSVRSIHPIVESLIKNIVVTNQKDHE